eukprot:361684-Chlamydomonas_euryale.AAC.3
MHGSRGGKRGGGVTEGTGKDAAIVQAGGGQAGDVLDGAHVSAQGPCPGRYIVVWAGKLAGGWVVGSAVGPSRELAGVPSVGLDWRLGGGLGWWLRGGLAGGWVLGWAGGPSRRLGWMLGWPGGRVFS